MTAIFSTSHGTPNDLCLRMRSGAKIMRSAGAIKTYVDDALMPHDLQIYGGRPDDLTFWHKSVDLGGLSLHYIDYQCDAELISVSVERPPSSLMVKFSLQGLTRLRAGGQEWQLGPNEFTVLKPGVPFEADMEGNCRHLSLVLNGDWISSYLLSRSCHLRPEDLNFDAHVFNLNTHGLLLSNVVAGLANGLAHSDSALSNQSVVTHLKDLITSSVLDFSPEFHKASAPQSDHAGLPEYVRLARNFIQEHLTDDIKLHDIVRASGMTKRTVQAGFRTYLGTTPLSFLKLMRLKATHDTLKASAPDGCTVTEVAMEYGFFHLSNFSQDFRKTFGVNPSEILNASQH